MIRMMQAQIAAWLPYLEEDAALQAVHRLLDDKLASALVHDGMVAIEKPKYRTLLPEGTGRPIGDLPDDMGLVLADVKCLPLEEARRHRVKVVKVGEPAPDSRRRR